RCQREKATAGSHHRRRVGAIHGDDNQSKIDSRLRGAHERRPGAEIHREHSMSPELTNPTQAIDLSFTRYLEDRHKQFADHWVNGATDYCFSLDRKMHQRLASIKPF